MAPEHSILGAAYHIFDRAVPYSDLGGDWSLRRHDPEPHARHLARQIEAAGFQVTLRPLAA